MYVFNLLSLAPIIVLLVISLVKGVKAGIYTGLVVTIILFFVWDSNIIAFPAALVAAFADTITILMIVFGALLLHQTMTQIGFMEGVMNSLKGIHTNRGFQFYFLALFLTSFFESVAGFGTPGAIVPPMLISMGYAPVSSIAVVLLFDGLLAISGAIGTPVTAGLAAPLGLSVPQEQSIYFIASILMLIAGAVLLLFINKDLNNVDHDAKRGSWKLLLSLFIPFVAISFFLQDISGVIASAILGIISYSFLFTNRKINWNPWLPYGVLILILLLPKIISPLSDLISWELSFKEIFGSGVSASLKPLKSPLIPFAITSLFALAISKVRKLDVKPVFSSSARVFMILFPSLAITQLMLNSGTDMPSMVETMAGLFAKTGDFYPLVSPFIGVLGTFITGSTTVSNIIFGSVQYNTASQLSLSTELILALQLGGASLGNAVCLFNIIAAAAVAQVTDYTAILKRNLLPVISAAFIIAVLGLLAATFL